MRISAEFRQVFNSVDTSGRGKVRIVDLVSVVGGSTDPKDIDYMTSEFDLHGL